MRRRGGGRGLLALTLATGLLLTIVPLPAALEAFRPYWVALVLLYWALEEQDAVSLGLSFVVGLFLDLRQQLCSFLLCLLVLGDICSNLQSDEPVIHPSDGSIIVDVPSPGDWVIPFPNNYAGGIAISVKQLVHNWHKQVR